ncbi:MAG: GntR family transcriptional regulator [Lachnospiraceae bacterium]|nr:GntR family transcriptional regulator [Lachnospiraceae bacterium]
MNTTNGRKEPKYRLVENWVDDAVKAGKLVPGDRLPSENEFTSMLGLSRVTVRHGIKELEKSGKIKTVRGSGSFLRDGSGVAVIPDRAKTGQIAIISTYVDGYIFPRTIRGIEEVLSENGCTVQISFTNNNSNRERKILKSLLSKDDIDGLIVEPSCGTMPCYNLSLYQELMDKGIPVLFFNAIYPAFEGKVPLVSLDDRTVAHRAAQLLIDAGHKKIGGRFKLDDAQGMLRFEGFQDAMLSSGLEMDNRRIIWFDSYASRHLSDRMDEISNRLKGCTAVQCYNDEIGCVFEDLIIKRGVRVPEDLSIVSIDDAAITGMVPVPFTTFPHPKEELGKKAAEIILKMIETRDFSGGYLYNPDPVMRGSIKNLLS